jgi:hypothetical protein
MATQPPSPQNITDVHLYCDSNTRDINTSLIKMHVNNINKQSNQNIKNYNIHIHTTYNLFNTQKEIQSRNHANSIVIINNITNHARFKHPLKQVEVCLHYTIETLRKQTPHIIVVESMPSLKFDIHPYNDLIYRVAKKQKVQWTPTLCGEAHIWHRDGIHLQRRHRPLLAMTYAAAICRQSPHDMNHPGPPEGPFGPWRSPWGNPGRPHPTSNWPIPPLFYETQFMPYGSAETWSNVVKAPTDFFRRKNSRL